MVLPLLTACVQSTGRGPDLGLCAEPPEGVYGFGEVGIGTCLSGPVDLAFVERDSESWLAVSNADPFINFSGGSVLFLNWASIQEGIDRGQDVLYTGELFTEAVPTERFVGALGVLPDRDLLMVASRLTEGGRTRSGEDEALVIDLLTGERYADGASVPLRDDPGDFVIDEAAGRAYALNFTDHSVSVLDTSGGPIRPIDLAPEAGLLELGFDDADGSGSVAEFDRLIIGEPTDVPSDIWTLSWLPGTVRAYVPGAEGLARWSWGGGSYVPDPFGDNISLPFPIEDAVIALPALESSQNSTSADLGIYFASEGSIHYAENSGGVDAWSLAEAAVIAPIADSWQETLSGPSLAVVAGVPALFYSGATTADPQHASIGMAVFNDALTFESGAPPVFEAPAGESYEQPFAQYDERRLSGRIWFSHFNGEVYQIAVSSFDDLNKTTVDFAPIELSLSLPDQSVAAPVVRYFDGAYHLWAARDDGTHWTHVTATSPDGILWGALSDLFVSEAPYDPRRPPRLAIQHEAASRWRIHARDLGVSTLPALPGARVVDLANGYSYTVANGHEVSSDHLFPLGRAGRGLVPSSHLQIAGEDRLYVTITGDDGRDRIAVIDDGAGTWDVLRQDLIPQGTGGNVGGASNPVVVQAAPDGPYVMFYAARGSDGLQKIRAATSDDGRVFTPVGAELFPDLAPWASADQQPHSVELLADGSVLLWISGNDGSRWRIGSVRIEGLASPDTASYTLERLEFTAFQLASGIPGGADDSGVKDPVVVNVDGERVMYYAGFDGTRWSLCRATFNGSEWIRRLHRDTDVTLPALTGTSGTFTTGGMNSPVFAAREDGPDEVFFAGYDTPEGADSIPRLGRAIARGPALYGAFKQPTFGDTLTLETQRGDEVASVIELEQRADTFATTGIGTTSLIHDEAAGMLYVPSKLTNLLYVIDVRADVRVGNEDANVLDLETVLRFDTIRNNAGFRGGAVDPLRERLYLTTRAPDGVAVLDLSAVVDNDVKEVTYGAFLGTLALQDDRQDRGAESIASIGGAEPLLVGDLLIVPNFKDNSVSIFDVSLGAFGAEVAYIPAIGENPHIAAVSPDGNWVVIANYLGDIEGDLANSTLALLDIDPTSPTYLTVPHWIKNR